jgi:pyruvate carboxylase subunit B
MDLAEKDPKKGIPHWKKILEDNKLPTTEENIFIAVSCQEKGIAFLQGKAKVNVRKLSDAPTVAPAEKPAEKKSEGPSYGKPTSLADMGSVNLAKPATYKLKVDNQSYFVEVEQLS